MRSATQQAVERRVEGRQARRAEISGTIAGRNAAIGLSRTPGDTDIEGARARLRNVIDRYSANDGSNQGTISRMWDSDAWTRSLPRKTTGRMVATTQRSGQATTRRMVIPTVGSVAATTSTSKAGD